MVSKGKPPWSMARWIEGFLCPVKPTKRTLPYVQVIRLQASQRFLQHLHGNIFLAAVGTDFGHHNRFIPLALERSAKALFACPFVVLPCVVEKIDPMVQGLRDHVVHFWLSSDCAKVVATHAENG